MKPAVQLIVTVLLVAGGIFVYDATLDRPPAASSDVIVRTEQPADAPAASHTPASEPSFPMLEGTGDDLWRAEVDRRLAELEVGGTDGGPDGGAPAQPGMATEPGAEGEEGGDEPLDPEVQKKIERQRLKWFRGMLEKVERQRRWEQAARKVKNYFDGLDLALTDEQMGNAVRTTVHYQGKWGQLKRQLDADQADEQTRRDGYTSMFAEYHDALRNVIPTSEADMIVTALKSIGRKDGGKR